METKRRCSNKLRCPKWSITAIAAIHKEQLEQAVAIPVLELSYLCYFVPSSCVAFWLCLYKHFLKKLVRIEPCPFVIGAQRTSRYCPEDSFVGDGASLFETGKSPAVHPWIVHQGQECLHALIDAKYAGSVIRITIEKNYSFQALRSDQYGWLLWFPAAISRSRSEGRIREGGQFDASAGGKRLYGSFAIDWTAMG
jgi:hypothetical protein